jgi:hypothetical protein
MCRVYAGWALTRKEQLASGVRKRLTDGTYRLQLGESGLRVGRCRTEGSKAAHPKRRSEKVDYWPPPGLFLPLQPQLSATAAATNA